MPKLPRSTSSATSSMASGTIPSRPAKPHPDRLKIMHLFPDRPLCPSGHAGDLGPGLKGLGPGGSILDGGAVIAAEVEEIVDLIVSGEEALGLARRLEPLHLPFSPSRRLMGVFGPVV